ncbi:hypothetical protein MLD38_016664 [Melastoma candidum]|uniref:Uncharacterized protein n=1 Tax=Melastoma candidum TaxID=119954 RepID=A0ACB9QPE1_9MYRT|nr:hypothetical protein MLD38_016664 [Melastoma candidum]
MAFHVFVFTAVLVGVVAASDHGPLQDFCVAQAGGVLVNGEPCKDPRLRLRLGVAGDDDNDDATVADVDNEEAGEEGDGRKTLGDVRRVSHGFHLVEGRMDRRMIFIFSVVANKDISYIGNAPRADSQLAMTRAFSDTKLKDNITSKPDITGKSGKSIDEDTDFVILASDGRPVKSNQEAANCIILVDDNAEEASKRLIGEALSRRSGDEDDTSCIVVKFT